MRLNDRFPYPEEVRENTLRETHRAAYAALWAVLVVATIGMVRMVFLTTAPHDEKFEYSLIGMFVFAPMLVFNVSLSKRVGMADALAIPVSIQILRLLFYGGTCYYVVLIWSNILNTETNPLIPIAFGIAVMIIDIVVNVSQYRKKYGNALTGRHEQHAE